MLHLFISKFSIFSMHQNSLEFIQLFNFLWFKIKAVNLTNKNRFILVPVPVHTCEKKSPVKRWFLSQKRKKNCVYSLNVFIFATCMWNNGYSTHWHEIKNKKFHWQIVHSFFDSETIFSPVNFFHKCVQSQIYRNFYWEFSVNINSLVININFDILIVSLPR